MLDETIAGIEINRTFPGLPGRDYYDDTVWQRERETVFRDSWFCVGRTEEMPNSGDYLAREVAGTSVVTVRGKDGQVRAFYNVCRHRGSMLCDEGAGSTKGAFSCPYHNWVYDLEGKLIGTPNVQAGDFDRSDYPLRSVACDVWEGFVFVHLGTEPRPLLDQLADEPDGPLEYERYAVGELRVGRRIVYEVKANWKIIHDNFNECLHCPGVHPELTALVPMYRKGMVFYLDRPDLGAELADGRTTFTLSGTSPLSMPFVEFVASEAASIVADPKILAKYAWPVASRTPTVSHKTLPYSDATTAMRASGVNNNASSSSSSSSPRRRSDALGQSGQHWKRSGELIGRLQSFRIRGRG